VSVLRLRLEPRDGEAFRREVRAGSAILGRSSKADIALADRFLSRQHARVFLSDGIWLLEDLGSRNTTFLNDRPVAEPTPLRPGDVIRLAESRVVVEGPGESIAGAGDGLVGDDDERLPGSTILRPAAQLLSEARATAAPGVRQAPSVKGEPLFSRRLVEEVVEKGVAALVTDASLDERFAAAESIVVSGVRSLVAAPLLDSEGCLGMIVLSARRRAHPFVEGDMELLAALASAAALRIRNLALTEETARRRLLDKELDLAADIQTAMLPRTFPTRAEIDVAAALRPARTVGGDLYDVVLEGDRLWMLVGDVSGKGVGAALLMAVTKTLFRAIAPGSASVASAMGRVNDELARDNERAMFVTVFAARLDLATGELRYVNGGHNPTYRLEADGPLTPLGGPVDPALGAVEGHEYRESTLALRPGDTLVLYTDGVVEARAADGEEFHSLRFESYLGGCRGAKAEDVVQGLLSRLEEFAGDAPPYDDVTVLVLRWLGSGLES